jgi:hypothetical protein
MSSPDFLDDDSCQPQHPAIVPHPLGNAEFYCGAVFIQEYVAQWTIVVCDIVQGDELPSVPPLAVERLHGHDSFIALLEYQHSYCSIPPTNKKQSNEHQWSIEKPE